MELTFLKKKVIYFFVFVYFVILFILSYHFLGGRGVIEF